MDGTQPIPIHPPPPTPSHTHHWYEVEIIENYNFWVTCLSWDDAFAKDGWPSLFCQIFEYQFIYSNWSNESALFGQGTWLPSNTETCGHILSCNTFQGHPYFSPNDGDNIIQSLFNETKLCLLSTSWIINDRPMLLSSLPMRGRATSALREMFLYYWEIAFDVIHGMKSFLNPRQEKAWLN